MLYSRSDALRGLGHVVMDEVHYLADRSRGAVWEEVIIHLPETSWSTSLSATVSNAEEFGDWLVTVRGNTEVVVEEHRPVPLFQHVMLGDRMYDLFEGPRERRQPGAGSARRARAEAPRFRERGQRPPRPPVPRRPDVLLRLDREGLLPAITFIFSRAGCAAAVEQCLRAGLRLNTDEERKRVRDARAAAHPRPPARRPAGPRLLGVARGPGARPGRAPRRHAADLQGGRRGAVRRRPGQGGVRHRDPRARHQHAGPLGRPREAGQVERRRARRGHAGGVHPAHRPGRSPRHRHRGPRRRALAAGARPAPGRWPRLHPHLPAPVELPAVVQHGRQPGRQRRAGAGAGAARELVRAVPGRPLGRRARPPGDPQPRGARGLPARG